MKNTREKVPSLLLLIVLVGFPQISESIFTPILPKLSEAFQVSGGDVQLTMSIYFVAFAFGVLFWGSLSDKIGRRPAMLYGVGVYLLGNIGLLLSTDFNVLLFCRLVQAFGASVGSVVTQTIMRESFHGVKKGQVFAKVGAAMSLSPALGPFLGSVIQMYLGYQNVFSALIIMATLVLFYSLFRLPETQVIVENQGQVKLRDITKALLTDKKVWSYGVVIGGINGILFSYYAEAPFIFMNHFGLSSVLYGSLGLILALASFLGAIFVNWLLNYWSAEKILFIGLGFAALGGILWLFAAMMNQMIFMIICIFCYFLGINIALPNALSQALKDYEAVIGSASGIFSFGYYILVSIFTYFMSVLHNGSIWLLPVYALVLTIVMLVHYRFIVYRK